MYPRCVFIIIAYLLGGNAPQKIWTHKLTRTVRVHKASVSAKPTFHSIDTRPGAEGGAIYNTGDALVWFDY